jgi:hypothetical protein
VTSADKTLLGTEASAGRCAPDVAIFASSDYALGRMGYDRTTKPDNSGQNTGIHPACGCPNDHGVSSHRDVSHLDILDFSAKREDCRKCWPGRSGNLLRRRASSALHATSRERTDNDYPFQNSSTISRRITQIDSRSPGPKSILVRRDQNFSTIHTLFSPVTFSTAR